MIRIYLAARYSRRLELCGHADELRALGFEITSRWRNGDHQLDEGGRSVEAASEERTRFATEDYTDVAAADWCISFTEAPRSSNSRGGRHVEFGVALGLEKLSIVIGPRENVFHCLPAVQVYPAWDEFMVTLKSQIERGWWPMGPDDDEDEDYEA